MFPDCSGSNYVSFVPAYSFALAYFSSGDFCVSACVLLSFLPFACQTAHLRFSRVACNLPLFPLTCQVLPTLFSIFFLSPTQAFFIRQAARPPCTVRQRSRCTACVLRIGKCIANRYAFDAQPTKDIQKKQTEAVSSNY